MKFTYGTDFEMFLQDQRTGQVVPICGLLGGTKEKPIQIPDAPEGFMYQEDGVTAEFNTPVCDSPAALLSAIRSAMSLGKKLVRKKLGKNYGLIAESAYTFDMEELAKHPKAMIIGCDPDFSARNQGEPREVPDIMQFRGQRFAGFHIHVGYDRDLIPPWMVALTLESYMSGPGSGSCVDRASFYPSDVFRPKPYGVEYRGLGSYFLRYPDQICDCLAVWERDMKANYGAVLDSSLARNEQRLMRENQPEPRVGDFFLQPARPRRLARPPVNRELQGLEVHMQVIDDFGEEDIQQVAQEAR